jgi:predicted flap endonuclease-1-like 5' DNA nuclease
VNGLSLIALIAAIAAIVVAYRVGVVRSERSSRRPAREPARWPEPAAQSALAPVPQSPRDPAPEPVRAPATSVASPQSTAGAMSYPCTRCVELDDDRHHLYARVADAMGETARLRQIVVDIERDAPPPLLDAPGVPDDLRLIVGIGPALERMLYQIGITRYRQIAHWSERDIDDVDAKLAEFPGRIRRDGWVAQARALHQSKYGERP